MRKNLKFLTTSPNYIPTACCESLITYNSRLPSHSTIVKKTSTNHITNLYWVSSSACPYQGYGQSNGYVVVFAWAVIKATQISRTIK